MPDTPTPPPGFQIDEAQSRQFGFPVATNAQGQRVRMRPTPAGRPGPTPRPEWGPGAVELPNGSVVRYGPRGGMTVLQTNQDGAGATPGAGGRGSTPGDAALRGRVNLGLDPVVVAQNDMMGREGRGNPYAPLPNMIGQHLIDTDRLPNNEPENGTQTRVGRFIGGDDLQLYNQASSTFESSLMPVFSGTAVTNTEAQRFIRANLPELGDSPAVLARKSRNRQMITNAAARVVGVDAPFPDVPSWVAGRNTAAALGDTGVGVTNGGPRPGPEAQRLSAVAHLDQQNRRAIDQARRVPAPAGRARPPAGPPRRPAANAVPTWDPAMNGGQGGWR